MNKVNVVLTVVMIVLVLMATGCGPNQWATKEVIDGSSMKQGEVITVQQKDGQNISGTFMGTATMPIEQYKEFYTAQTVTKGTEGVLPRIGDPIVLSTSLVKDKVWQGEFLGFSEQALLVKMDGESKTSELFIPSVVALSGKNGKSLERMEFRNMFLNGNIPLMTSLVLRSSTGDVQVPITSIKELTVSQESGTQSVTMNVEQFLASRASAK